jgi:hypothetical protein
VSGGDPSKDVGSIVVILSRGLQFQLVIPQHNIQSKSYGDKVVRFRILSAKPDHPFDLDHVERSIRDREEEGLVKELSRLSTSSSDLIL